MKLKTNNENNEIMTHLTACGHGFLSDQRSFRGFLAIVYLLESNHDFSHDFK